MVFEKFLRMRKGDAFTLIEVLVVIAIIGILAAIILVSVGISARNKTAVEAYKSSMSSVQAAMEICSQGSAAPVSGAQGAVICGGSELYPILPARCGAGIGFTVSGAGSNWGITTDSSCQGCRMNCSVVGCTAIEDSPGDCF